MASKLSYPLDQETVEGLRKLGKDIVGNKAKREAFLKSPKSALASYGLKGLDPSKLDKSVVAMLADPRFQDALNTKNVKELRAYVQDVLGERSANLSRAGTFDFDFDVEFEVEVVAVAIAVFDFAVQATKVPTASQMKKRRELVAQAFETLKTKQGR
jgi:hypothetical protein